MINNFLTDYTDPNPADPLVKLTGSTPIKSIITVRTTIATDNPRIKEFYVRAITKSGVYNYQMFKILVCGAETVTTTE